MDKPSSFTEYRSFMTVREDIFTHTFPMHPFSTPHQKIVIWNPSFEIKGGKTLSLSEKIILEIPESFLENTHDIFTPALVNIRVIVNRELKNIQEIDIFLQTSSKAVLYENNTDNNK